MNAFAAGTIVGCILAVFLAIGAPSTPQRSYWTVPLDSLAIGHARHTHVETRGEVIYVRTEDDGDTHIRLANPSNHAQFIIAECIPKLPCAKPRAGADIIVRGISRRDPEHGWYEIHPLESWSYATAGE